MMSEIKFDKDELLAAIQADIANDIAAIQTIAPDTSLRIIAEIVESLLILTPAERGTVAKELAEADAVKADEFAVQLLASVDAVEDSRYVRMWKRIIASINADEHDYEAQTAGAQ